MRAVWARLVRWLHGSMLDVIARRPCDVSIGGEERPYLLRWYLTPWSALYREIPDDRKTWWQWFVSHLPNLYLHVILRDDDDRALHDHPWPFVSLTLDGGYYEHTIARGGTHHAAWYGTGTVKLRRAGWAHRLSLPCLSEYEVAWLGGSATARRVPCTTLVVTGPRFRQWGFHCPKRWVHWRDFTDPDTRGQTVGRGCE